MFPAILFALTDKKFKMEEVVLHGFKRHSIFDNGEYKRYPAIIKKENSQVKGKLLFDVDDESMSILDFFEDDSYYREIVEVLKGDEKVSAFVYIWKPELKEKLKEDWDPEEFKKFHLTDYVNKVIPEDLKEYNKNNKK